MSADMSQFYGPVPEECLYGLLMDMAPALGISVKRDGNNIVIGPKEKPAMSMLEYAQAGRAAGREMGMAIVDIAHAKWEGRL